MNPLSSIFGVGVRARNFLYDHGVLPQRSLQGPVVSIGNLSVGGAGKTPFVILLGELLKARGIKFDILSRGYRRKNQAISLVDENGSPRDFVDEPLLLTRRLQVPVIVAGNPKDQVEALEAAGVEGFVHVGSDAVETLTDWQNRLGVRN